MKRFREVLLLLFNENERQYKQKKMLFASFESLLKIINNAFYFILKAFLVLKIFSFGHDSLSCWRNGLMRKVRLILKLMTSQPVYKQLYYTYYQYLIKLKQPNNDTWSIGWIFQEKYFSLKITQKKKQGD